MEDFAQLWQVSRFSLADLQPATVEALSRPPLRWLGPDEAAERQARIEAVPFTQLYGLLAVVTTCRAADSMAALELLGVIESEDGDTEEAIEPVGMPSVEAFPAPPPPEPPPGPAAPAPLTLPVTEISTIESAPSEAAAEPAGGGRNCRHCGCLFTPSRQRRAYCSAECSCKAKLLRQRRYYVHRRPEEEERRCEECGESFRPLRDKHRFCSAQCQAISQQRRERQTRAAARPIKSCPECSASFQPLKRSTQLFCTPACQRAFNTRKAGWQPLRVERACVVCAAPYTANRGGQKTCGDACRQEWRKRQWRRPRENDRVAALVQQFASPGRWRWLLRQVNAIGLDGIAQQAGISVPEAIEAMVRIRLRQPAVPTD